MTMIPIVASPSPVVVSRVDIAARLAGNKGSSIEQFAQEDANGDLAIQKRDATLAAMQRGEGTLVTTPIVVVGKYTGVRISETAHKSYEEMTKSTEPKEVHAMGALNVADLIKDGRVNDAIDYYTREVAVNRSKHADFGFTGAWGSDKVTNSPEEYIGWLKQAAAAYAKTASLSE